MKFLVLSFVLIVLVSTNSYSVIYPYLEFKVKNTKLAQPPEILNPKPFQDSNGVEGLEFPTFNYYTKTFSTIRVPNGALIERLQNQEPPLIIRPGTAIKIPAAYRFIYYQNGQITIADGPILFVGDYLHTMNGLTFGKGSSEVIGVIKKESPEDELFCSLRDAGMLQKIVDDDNRTHFVQDPDGPLRIISRMRYEAYTSPKSTDNTLFRKAAIGDTPEIIGQKTSDLKKIEDKETKKIADILSLTLKPEKDLGIYSVVGYRYAFLNAPAYILFYFHNNALMRVSVVHFPIECDWKYPETRNAPKDNNSVVEAFGDAGSIAFGDDGWSVIKAVEQTKQNRIAEEQYVARLTEALFKTGFKFYRDSKGLTEEKVARTGWFLGESVRSFANKSNVTAEIEKRELRYEGKTVSYILLEIYDRFQRYKLLADEASDRILQKAGIAKTEFQKQEKIVDEGKNTSIADLGGQPKDHNENSSKSQTGEANDLQPPDGYKIVTIIEPDFQNMRKDPNGKSEIVAQLPTGETIFVENSTAKWIKAIRPKDNTTGYVFREMLGGKK